jgi:hypothetical protein
MRTLRVTLKDDKDEDAYVEYNPMHDHEHDVTKFRCIGMFVFHPPVELLSLVAA